MKIIASITSLLFLGISVLWYAAVIFRTVFIDVASGGHKNVDFIFYTSLFFAWVLPIIFIILAKYLYSEKNYKYAAIVCLIGIISMTIIGYVNIWLVDDLQKKADIQKRENFEVQYSQAKRDFMPDAKKTISPITGEFVAEEFIEIKEGTITHWSQDGYSNGSNITYANKILGSVRGVNLFVQVKPDELATETKSSYLWRNYSNFPQDKFSALMSFKNNEGKTLQQVYQPESWMVYLASGYFKVKKTDRNGNVYEGSVLDSSINIWVFGEYYNMGNNLRLHITGSDDFYDYYYRDQGKGSQAIVLEFKKGTSGKYNPIQPLSEVEVSYLKKVDTEIDSLRTKEKIPEYLSKIINF